MSNKKRSYVDCEFDENLYAQNSQSSLLPIETSANDGSTARVRRVRIGFDVQHTTRNYQVLQVAGVSPVVDYGFCRVCSVAVGNAPFEPAAMIAKFAAAQQTMGMGAVTYMEHSSCVQLVEVPDQQADVVYAINIPQRMPGECECSEQCYVLYRVTPHGPDSIVGRVLAMLGYSYADSTLTPTRLAGVMRIRQRFGHARSLMGHGKPPGFGAEENAAYFEYESHACMQSDVAGSSLLPSYSMWSGSSVMDL